MVVAIKGITKTMKVIEKMVEGKRIKNGRGFLLRLCGEIFLAKR